MDKGFIIRQIKAASLLWNSGNAKDIKFLWDGVQLSPKDYAEKKFPEDCPEKQEFIKKHLGEQK